MCDDFKAAVFRELKAVLDSFNCVASICISSYVFIDALNSNL